MDRFLSIHLFSGLQPFILSFVATFVLILSIGMVLIQPKTAFSQDYSAIIERCEPYRTQVEHILRSEGVSTDYYYLMVAESRCTEKASSKAGAMGFWQLMPSTAKHYGCFHPHDLECATKAAARYIQHLQKTFKTFEEVIAAYNMGGHNFKQYGATNQAKGLIFLVKRLLREADKPEDTKEMSE